jgi:hypothetical protein
MSNNHRHSGWMNRLRDSKDMLDEWLARESVKYLRHPRLHSRALSGGQDDDVKLRVGLHLALDLFFGALDDGIHVARAATGPLRHETHGLPS